MRVVEKILKYLLVIAILVASTADYGDAFAQRRKRSRTRKDAVQIKAPSIRRKKQARQIKSTKKRRAEAPRANGKSKAPRRVYYRQFMPTKEPAMVSEVQDSLNDAETNVVEVEEQVRMDCTWVKVTEYYSLWDSRRVNPYGVDKKTIQDTATITLFDTSMGAGYHVPVNQTFVTSRFGARGGRFHYGADLELDIGDSIFRYAAPIKANTS